MSSSKESLRQLRQQVNGLMSETDSYLNGEVVRDTEGLEQRNQELAALLDQKQQQISQLQSQLLRTQFDFALTNMPEPQLFSPTCQEQLSQHQSSLQSQQDAAVQLKSEEVATLQQQLQVHIQTIGILVAEKTELQSALNLSQQTVSSKTVHVVHAMKIMQFDFALTNVPETLELEDLQMKLKSLRIKLAEKEREFTSISQFNEMSDKNTKELSSELEKEKKEGEKLRHEVEEMKEKYNTKMSECQNLEQAAQELRNQLQLAQLYSQQLQSPQEVQNQLEQLQNWNVSLQTSLEQAGERHTELIQERDSMARAHQAHLAQCSADLATLCEELGQVTQQLSLRSREVENLREQLDAAVPSAPPPTEPSSTLQMEQELCNLRTQLEQALKQNEELRLHITKITTQTEMGETSYPPHKTRNKLICFPHLPDNPHKHETHPELLKALGLQIIEENSSLFDITIYTDGSQLETGLSGSGIAIYKDKILEKISLSHPRHLSVYKSELSAIDTALKDININSPSKIIIYSDSRAAIYTLQSCFSSQEPLLKSIAKSVNRLPANSSVTVQWLPPHVGIPGNELADSLAKAGALGLPEARESTTQLDERDLLRTIKTQCLQEWKSDAAHMTGTEQEGQAPDQDNQSLRELAAEQEMTLERWQEQEVDREQLLASIQSDKVAASRATAQNKDLKCQLEELQAAIVAHIGDFDCLYLHMVQAMIIMSNAKLELTEELSHERHVSKELGERLGEQEEEMNQLQEEVQELRKQTLVMSQLEDKVRHYEAQQTSSTEIEVLQATLDMASARMSSSKESLRQLRQQVNGLMSETDSYLNGEVVRDTEGLEQRNQELAALLDQKQQQISQLQSQLLRTIFHTDTELFSPTCQEQLSQHQSSLQSQQDAAVQLKSEEVATLQQQLQVHIQTIGILVAEKTELQSALNLSQQTVSSKTVHVVHAMKIMVGRRRRLLLLGAGDLQMKLKSLRIKLAEKEREFTSISQFNEMSDKNTKELSSELEKEKKEGEKLRWRIGERPSDMKASCETSRITLTNKQSRTNSSIVRREGPTPGIRRSCVCTHVRVGSKGVCFHVRNSLKLQAKKQVDDLRHEVEEMKEKYNTKMSECQNLEQAAQELRNQLQLAQLYSQQLQSPQEVQNQLEQLQNWNVSLQTSLEQAGERHTELIQERDSMARAHQAHLAQCSADLATLREELGQVTQQLSLRSREVENLREQLDAAVPSTPPPTEPSSTLQMEQELCNLRIQLEQALKQNEELRLHITKITSFSVYKSELSAIDTALKDININSPSKIIIYSDSRAAIYTLQSCFSSQEPLLKSIAKSVNRLPANSSVTVQWLPAHVGIPGNELADSLAKAGALGLPEARESTTQLDERDLLRTIKTQCLQEWKSDAAHDWYRAGGTSTGSVLPREQQSLISRLKSGHLWTMTFQNGCKDHDNQSLRELAAEQEMTLERWQEQEVDREQLLASIQSDKVAASRATAQNKDLKCQLEELQAAIVAHVGSLCCQHCSSLHVVQAMIIMIGDFDCLYLHMVQAMIIMSNAKLELTEELSHERHVSKELGERLGEQEEEMNQLQEEVQELRKQTLVMSQLEDKVRHYETQQTSSTEIEVLQKRLEEVQAQNVELRAAIARQAQESIPNEPSRELARKDDLVAALSASVQQLEAERNQLLHTMGEQQTQRSSLRAQLSQLHAQDDPGRGDSMVSQEEYRALKSSMEQLEAMIIMEKFRETMNKMAELSDEKQHLEHLVTQLQGETETIGDYIQLYQVQRGLMKKREAEKDEYIALLAQDRETLKEELRDLQVLVQKLLKDQSNQESPEQGPAGESPHQVASHIQSLLHHLECQNLLEGPQENFHPCHFCSGRLLHL
ncbi:GOLGA2 [Cordylochernes scorpioides]|uniref:GOLGA2 n=1 Tax=Cordylochernes scorpioides TaxID=51811 RepID=A0ABY6L9S9_9ARAC|nr:GOLGA2 [Cordylochernes scorpioides]